MQKKNHKKHGNLEMGGFLKSFYLTTDQKNRNI